MAYPSRRSSSSLETRETYSGEDDGAQLERRATGGQMLFTGPDYIRDHRVSVEPEHRYVGIGTMSPEGTSEVAYLWRASTRQSHPRPKSTCVGEIGWGVPRLADCSPPQTGVQIKLGEFRQAVEDRHTHLYQNAWYPDANEYGSSNNNNLVTLDRPSSGSAANRQNGGSSCGSYDRRSSTESNYNNSNNRRSYSRPASSLYMY